MLIAGMCAGMTEAVLAVTPTETVKTKLIQANRSTGFLHGIRDIIGTEGWSGLYRGSVLYLLNNSNFKRNNDSVIPTMLRQGCNSAIRFSVYGSMQTVWMSRLAKGQQQFGTVKSFLSGAVAGTVATMLTMPIDVVKTRLQGRDAAKLYQNSTWRCFISVLRTEGWRALWKGTTPRLSRVVCSSGIVFSVQDKLMQLLTR
jgi:solute carrier family 25 citrate transporter 1